MTDRQTVAVACAINPDPNGGYSKAHLAAAKAAIAASDAGLVPGLAVALEEIVRRYDGDAERLGDMDHYNASGMRRVAIAALAALPEEYRK